MKLKTTLYFETNQISSSNHVFSRKNKNLSVLIFHISRARRVGWWNLIKSVRLKEVGNNRNDHFRYFLGVRVRLIEVSAFI